jgi:hypothetical protein
MRKHAGTWALRLSAEDILIKGKALQEPFDQLSHRDFEEYIREKYDIDYRRALDWLNAARRFSNRLELINGLTEATIRKLAEPSLTMPEVERIIAQLRAGTIKADYRSVEQAIRSLKTANVPQEHVNTLSLSSTSLTQSTQLSQRVLEEMADHKKNLETSKARIEKDLATLRKEKENLLSQLSAFDLREKQLQAESSQLDIQIQTLAPVLELYERDFKTK